MSGQQAQNGTVLGNWRAWAFGLYVCWGQISSGPYTHQPHSLGDKLDPNQKINFLKKYIHCAKYQENTVLRCGIGWRMWGVGAIRSFSEKWRIRKILTRVSTEGGVGFRGNILEKNFPGRGNHTWQIWGKTAQRTESLVSLKSQESHRNGLESQETDFARSLKMQQGVWIFI